MKPVGDRVVVAVVDNEDVSPGGILIPETAQEKSQRGRVIGVGPLADGVTDGSEVLFAKYAGTELKVGDQKVVVLRADDILAVIE